jgi:hypothetical protein
VWLRISTHTIMHHACTASLAWCERVQKERPVGSIHIEELMRTLTFSSKFVGMNTFKF